MFGLFRNRGRSRSRHPAPRAPDGARLFAIGDIHGCCDLLLRLREQIKADIEAAPPGQAIVVFLGDYIDRGLQSRETIDALLGWNVGDAVHFLRGNHEQMLLDFCADARTLESWRRFGGLATLSSYGAPVAETMIGENYQKTQEAFLDATPESHQQFFHKLALHCTFGDYFFCHAGVDPRKPLDRQSPEDLTWIREAFLDCDSQLEKFVVHGHSPTPEPDVRANRMGVDTGAYATGKLTCAVLEGQSRRFLTARGGARFCEQP